MKVIKSPIYKDLKNYLDLSNYDNKILYIFVPFIQTDVLKVLLRDTNSKVIIVTTWKPFDLVSGISELALYLFCKKNNYTLYINNKLHLKIYSRDLDSIFLATANISSQGLGTSPYYSYECGVEIPVLDSSDRLYFNKILHESIHVDDDIYKQLFTWIRGNEKKIPQIEKFEEVVNTENKDQFLISALPMTKDIKTLEECYLKINKGIIASDNDEVRNCVFHDLANYHIDIGLSIQDFRNELTNAFFSHPFIHKIDEIINPEAYFGRIKEWVQRNCTDVPVPSRRELTGNVQVLLKWFETLGAGKYVVDIPGSHSQRIRKIT